MQKPDPINPTDDAARATAHAILRDLRFGALAATHPDTGTPTVSRVALLWRDGALLTLVSTLSLHTRAIIAAPACAVLAGEVQDKGDPLTHPRMTLHCTAAQTDKGQHKAVWLGAIPKAKLYFDFADFIMVRLQPHGIDLNGGFGKAYRLQPADLLPR